MLKMNLIDKKILSFPSGVPQPFLPRSLSIQQHSIMGQPYIELRHRTPENRLRLPFSLPSATDPEAPLLHPRDPHPPAIRSGPGARMGETLMAQQMITAGAVEQLNQQGPQQQHLGHTAALTQPGEPALSGADGIEEHLEGEDSAVKDLEDVEVKDLVDLNLNLDPEDGMSVRVRVQFISPSLNPEITPDLKQVIDTSSP